MYTYKCIHLPPLSPPSPPPPPPVSLLSTVQQERMKFLCIGTKTGVEVYAWAQKPYSKFMAFKVHVHVCDDNYYIH